MTSAAAESTTHGTTKTLDVIMMVSPPGTGASGDVPNWQLVGDSAAIFDRAVQRIVELANQRPIVIINGGLAPAFHGQAAQQVLERMQVAGCDVRMTHDHIYPPLQENMYPYLEQLGGVIVLVASSEHIGSDLARGGIDLQDAELLPGSVVMLTATYMMVAQGEAGGTVAREESRQYVF